MADDSLADDGLVSVKHMMDYLRDKPTQPDMFPVSDQTYIDDLIVKYTSSRTGFRKREVEKAIMDANQAFVDSSLTLDDFVACYEFCSDYFPSKNPVVLFRKVQ